jgi:hypothetical protein
MAYFFDELEEVSAEMPLKIKISFEGCDHQAHKIKTIPWYSASGLDRGFYFSLSLNLELVSESNQILARRRLNDFYLSWKLLRLENKKGFKPIFEKLYFDALLKETSQCAEIRELDVEVRDSFDWIFSSEELKSHINKDLLGEVNEFLSHHLNPRFLGAQHGGNRLGQGRYRSEAVYFKGLTDGH